MQRYLISLNQLFSKTTGCIFSLRESINKSTNLFSWAVIQEKITSWTLQWQPHGLKKIKNYKFLWFFLIFELDFLVQNHQPDFFHEGLNQQLVFIKFTSKVWFIYKTICSSLLETLKGKSHVPRNSKFCILWSAFFSVLTSSRLPSRFHSWVSESTIFYL